MTIALANELNLDDQLFTYGVRVNYAVVQDIISNFIAVVSDASSQLAPALWLYYPLVSPLQNHVITKNIAPVWLRYPAYIDTVGRNEDIQKTVLLQTSELSRIRAVPAMIEINEVRRTPDPSIFNNQHLITAILLEGSFPSVFRNRNARNMFDDLREQQAQKSVPTKMIVVADGDIARNDVRITQNGLIPSNPLGFDRNTRETFGNKDFLINAINYLTDDAGLTNLRNREFKLRLLNRKKVVDEQFKWQIINIVLPMLILIVGGILYNKHRKYRYGRV
jgi:ABC-2 type transport system permease protein